MEEVVEPIALTPEEEVVLLFQQGVEANGQVLEEQLRIQAHKLSKEVVDEI